MHVVRWIIVSFLILAIMIASSTQTWTATSQAWEQTRPEVIEVMDGLYAILRDFVAGSDPHEGIDGDAPGVDYDIIITMDRGNLL